MSLINDALRKARESQPASIKPADGPPLRPIESPRGSASRLFLLTFLLAVLFILACVLLLASYRDNHSELRVHAATSAGEADSSPASDSATPEGTR